jgi:hypothetical protein
MKKWMWTIGVVFLMGVPFAKAQTVNDPLKNPYVWNKLKNAPSDNKLWSAYFGKDLFDMTAEEGINYRKWKSYLSDLKTTEDEDQDYIARQMRLGKVNHDPDYTQLLSNVETNFALIEDYFEGAFKKTGQNLQALRSGAPHFQLFKRALDIGAGELTCRAS